nr:PREDICTED: tyrosine-protein phosphatase 12-like [Latimeria chalumnae]|eukprot:XP_014339819.1 PREDICTED: tyrosine-protein phosphatase 12-like [Latimeria chalumnae]
MVWQERSAVIVMLTGLVENGKVKCDQYWPELTETYSGITVSLCSVERTTETIVQTFEVEKVIAPRRILQVQKLHSERPRHLLVSDLSILRVTVRI